MAAHPVMVGIFHVARKNMEQNLHVQLDSKKANKLGIVRSKILRIYSQTSQKYFLPID